MNQKKSAPEYDENLWFTMGDCCAGKHYLLYNSHTFPGRMGAWCPLKEVTFCVSKSEMTELSSQAVYWVKGFLAGNEPDAPTDKNGDYLPEDHPRYQHWRAEIEQFPETGYWKFFAYLCEECGAQASLTQDGIHCFECGATREE